MKKILAILLVWSSFHFLSAEAIVELSLSPGYSEISAAAEQEYVLGVHIAKDWHINSANPRDAYSIPSSLKLEAEGQGLSIKNIRYPEGKIVSTSWAVDLSLYEASLEIPFTLNTSPSIQPGDYNFRLLFSYQACNDITCLTPESVAVHAKIRVQEGKAEEITAKLLGDVENIGDQKELENVLAREEESAAEQGPFGNKSLALVLLIVFAMGLALNLTPCVYPLIPITMGFFIAQKERRSPLLLAVLYVIGLALTYSLIGTLAAFGGKMMGSLLAHPATLIFFALLMLALALSMFGLFEFRLPSKLTQASGGSRSGALGALLMGLTMGIVAAPCVGPFVISLLSFVAQKGSVIIGFISFFILALGLGVPYLFLGIFSGKIANLPRSGEWLNGVRVFFGLALLGMALYFIQPLLSGKIATLLLPVYMIASAVYYALIDRSGQNLPVFMRIKTLIAMLVLAIALLMIKPTASTEQSLSWENYSLERFEEAIKTEQPIIIDFYADWCNPCKELNNITFNDSEVKALLEGFVRFKVDLTIENAENRAIRENFAISGVPTLIFYTKNGKEQQDLRLAGFEKPSDFSKRLRSVLEP